MSAARAWRRPDYRRRSRARMIQVRALAGCAARGLPVVWRGAGLPREGTRHHMCGHTVGTPILVSRLFGYMIPDRGPRGETPPLPPAPPPRQAAVGLRTHSAVRTAARVPTRPPHPLRSCANLCPTIGRFGSATMLDAAPRCHPSAECGYRQLLHPSPVETMRRGGALALRLRGRQRPSIYTPRRQAPPASAWILARRFDPATRDSISRRSPATHPVRGAPQMQGCGAGTPPLGERVGVRGKPSPVGRAGGVGDWHGLRQAGLQLRIHAST